jgi:hypothetical protein
MWVWMAQLGGTDRAPQMTVNRAGAGSLFAFFGCLPRWSPIPGNKKESYATSVDAGDRNHRCVQFKAAYPDK